MRDVVPVLLKGPRQEADAEQDDRIIRNIERAAGNEECYAKEDGDADGR